MKAAAGSISQEDLAVMIGVGRQTINRLLKSLEQDGIATTKYTSVTIHNLEAIERLSLSEGVDGWARTKLNEVNSRASDVSLGMCPISDRYKLLELLTPWESRIDAAGRECVLASVFPIPSCFQLGSIF